MKNLLRSLLFFPLLASTLHAQEYIPRAYQPLLEHPQVPLQRIYGLPDGGAAGFGFAGRPNRSGDTFAFFVSPIDVSKSTLTFVDLKRGTWTHELPWADTFAQFFTWAEQPKRIATVAFRRVGKVKKNDDQTLSPRLLIWDYDVNREIDLGPDDSVFGPALSPSGRWLSTASQQKLAIWDLDAKKKLHELDWPKDSGKETLFLDDDTLAAAWGKELRLFRPSSGEVLLKIPVAEGPVGQLIAASDGSRIAFASGGQGRVVDRTTGKTTAEFPAPEPLNLLHLTAAGDRIVLGQGLSAKWDWYLQDPPKTATLMAWDLAGKKKAWSHTFAGAEGMTSVLTGEKEVWVGGGAKPSRRFQLDSGNVTLVGGHTAPVTGVGTNAGGLLYSLGSDGEVKIWSSPTRVTSMIRFDPIVAFFSDPQRKSVLFVDECRRLWNPSPLDGMRILTGHKDRIVAWACSDAGTEAATASLDRVVKVWDLADAKKHISFETSLATALLCIDRKTLVTGHDDGRIRIWPLDKFGTDDFEPATIDGHKRAVTVLAKTPEGIVSGGGDGAVKLWKDRKLVRSFEGHKNWINAMAWAGPRYLITSSDDLTLKIWDATDGKVVTTVDLGAAGDSPKSLAVRDRTLYVGTAGWVVLEMSLAGLLK